MERDMKNLDKNLLQAEKNGQILKQQLDELDENYKKLVSNYFPRLGEIQKQQEQVIQEVEKMKKGVEYFPSMFRAEKLDKSRIVHQGKILETKIEVNLLQFSHFIGNGDYNRRTQEFKSQPKS